MTQLKYFGPNEGIGLDEFPGRTWNEHNRTTELVQKMAQRPDHRFGVSNVTWIMVQNISGSDVDYGGVLAFGATLADAEGHQGFVMEGVSPAEADTFGITLKKIPNNTVGPVAIAGVVRANVFIRHAELQWVDIDVGRTDRMISHPAGRCKVLETKSPGTHRTWVVMNYEGPTKWRCRPRVDIARGNFGDVDLYGINPTIPIDVLGPVWLDWLTPETVPKSSEAICTYFRLEKLWRLTHAECSVTTTAKTYQNSLGTDYTNKDGIAYESPPN